MMSVANETETLFHPSDDDQLADYTAPSGLAIVGFLLGLASALVLWRFIFLILPAAAIILNLLALARIRANAGRLTGHRIAMFGLCLGVFFAAAAVGRTTTRQLLIVHYARPLADQFFAALAADQPQKAIQLMQYPGNRQPFDAKLWDHYRKNEEAREGLTKFVKYPLIRTLLALGDTCQVRYYQSGGVQRTSSFTEMVTLIYAVTFHEADQKRSFLVTIRLDRQQPPADRTPRWRIASFDLVRKPHA